MAKHSVPMLRRRYSRQVQANPFRTTWFPSKKRAPLFPTVHCPDTSERNRTKIFKLINIILKRFVNLKKKNEDKISYYFQWRVKDIYRVIRQILFPNSEEEHQRKWGLSAWFDKCRRRDRTFLRIEIWYLKMNKCQNKIKDSV